MPRDLYAPQSAADLPLFSKPASPAALLARDRAIESLTRRSGEDFIAAAADFILAQLRANGPATSEQLVDACKAAGMKPEDDRAFGPVIARLSRQKKIVHAGYVQRSKGHGSPGLAWSAAK